MPLEDFFSREAGQRRRAWLDGKTQDALEALRYYGGPAMETPLNALGVASMFNPVNDAGEAMAAGRDGRTVDMLTNTAAVAAPAVAGKVAKAYNPGMVDDAAQWLQDAIMGLSVNPTRAGVDDLAREFVADETGALKFTKGAHQGGHSAPNRNPDNASPQPTPAQAEAQNVLDLLQSGRADEVTDDMLAASDDMYLFNNYDLPMDEASRMARAKEMGFDVDTPLYHGSELANIDRFDPSLGFFDLPATFFSENPDLAKTYGPNVGEYFGRMEYPAEFDANGGVMQFFDGKERSPADLVRRISEVREDAVKYGVDEESDLIYDLYEAGVDPHYADEIDSVTMRNSADSLHLLGGPTGDNHAIFNPANIRSRFARFDPRLKHLSNLSAAGAGGAVVLDQMTQQQEQQDVLDYLKSVGAL